MTVLAASVVVVVVVVAVSTHGRATVIFEPRWWMVKPKNAYVTT